MVTLSYLFIWILEESILAVDQWKYGKYVSLQRKIFLQWKYGKWKYAFYFINVSQYFMFKYIIKTYMYDSFKLTII